MDLIYSANNEWRDFLSNKLTRDLAEVCGGSESCWLLLTRKFIKTLQKLKVVGCCKWRKSLKFHNSSTAYLCFACFHSRKHQRSSDFPIFSGISLSEFIFQFRRLTFNFQQAKQNEATTERNTRRKRKFADESSRRKVTFFIFQFFLLFLFSFVNKKNSLKIQSSKGAAHTHNKQRRDVANFCRASQHNLGITGGKETTSTIGGRR